MTGWETHAAPPLPPSSPPPPPPIKKTAPVDIIVSFFETGATGSYLVWLYTILRLCQDADRSLSGLSRVAAGGANPDADPRGGRTRGCGWWVSCQMRNDDVTTNLKQGWLLVLWNKIQTHKRLKRNTKLIRQNGLCCHINVPFNLSCARSSSNNNWSIYAVESLVQRDYSECIHTGICTCKHYDWL